MERGFRGRARGRAGYVGRGHGRAFEAIVPAVDAVDATEKGVGHGGGGVLSPSASQDKDVPRAISCAIADLNQTFDDDGGKGDADDRVLVKEEEGLAKKKDNVDEDKKDGGGVALDDWSYQRERGGRRGGGGGWNDQRRGGRDRGGFNKRGFGGGRGGRGDGRGKWSRSGGGGFGGNRWSVPRDPKADIRSGDSDNPGTSKSSAEIIEYWSDASAPLLPQVPFEYTPWETTFHIEAREFLEDLRASRAGLLVDERGVPYDDCRTSHGYGLVCQFCDGRDGPWVHENANKNDPAFKRYQESILRSPFQFSKTGEEAAARDVVKLGVEADGVAEEGEPPVSAGEDFGIPDPEPSPEEANKVAEEQESSGLVEDFGMFDRKLCLTE